jgi:hypothetical protein
MSSTLSAGADAHAAIAAATADTRRMAHGLPGVGLELLMPDYPAQMAGLARNVEAGRISLLLAVLTKEDTSTIGPASVRPMIDAITSVPASAAKPRVTVWSCLDQPTAAVAAPASAARSLCASLSGPASSHSCTSKSELMKP